MFGIELADHLDMDHERELPSLSIEDYGLIGNIHAEMHRSRDDWGHKHTARGVEYLTP